MSLRRSYFFPLLRMNGVFVSGTLDAYLSCQPMPGPSLDMLPPEAPMPDAVPPPPEDTDVPVQLPAPPRAPRGPRDKDGPPSHRDDIAIPDYTLIKRVGSGAYGEVWLAQSVTGAYRAVKIVWREDFELTRTFHREFLGIQ